MKKITKRDCEFWHAKKRLGERYDLILTKELEKRILSLINTQYSVFVEKQSNTRKTFLVRDPDSEIEYLFIKISYGGIITFLDRTWLLKTFEEMIEINREKQQAISKEHKEKVNKIKDELYEIYGLKS